MNKIKIWALCLLGVMLLASCDRFLDLKPQDQRVVKTVEDYRDIMASYMNALKTPNRSQDGNILGLSTDCFPAFNPGVASFSVNTGEVLVNQRSSDIYDESTHEYKQFGRNLMTWLRLPYGSAWKINYRFLGMMNIIVSGIETADGENELLRRYVQGEALVWRAYCYFKLLQLYSPYKNNELGIPVYLTPDGNVGTAMPKRQSQKEVFAQILADCNRTLELLEVAPTAAWNFAYRADFVHAMMASVYAWKAMSGAAEDGDWHNAEIHATTAMGKRALTSDPEVIREMFDCKDVTVESSMISDEFFIRLLDGQSAQLLDFASCYYNTFDNSYVLEQANPEYYNMYKDNDIRKNVYFTGGENPVNNKYNLLGNSQVRGCGSLMPFRLAEMYLIKAEALTRQGKAGEAAQVLRTFKESRYEGDFTVPSDQDGLLQEILDERTREFFQEVDFRWLDMKRLGISVKRILDGEEYVLLPDDFRYCLPIPLEEMETNKAMEQTPGWDEIILEK